MPTLHPHKRQRELVGGGDSGDGRNRSAVKYGIRLWSNVRARKKSNLGENHSSLAIHKGVTMDDLGTIFSLNNWPGHLSYVLIAVSYWLTNMFCLRLVAVVGLSLEILYFWLLLALRR